MGEERRKFIALLESLGCYCRVEDGKTIVYVPEGSKTYSIILNSVNSIPPDFVFSVPGDVWMDVDAIPQGVEFRNGGNVILASTRRIHSSVRILNEGEFVIRPFQSEGNLLGEGEFKFKAEGISNRRILRKMIEIGLFDKS